MDNLYSFVLPAYKAKYFKEAIDSILAQTYTKFELIIINDDSPEDLDSIIKKYDDSRIRYYVNAENLGGENLVAQWNKCIQYANGEFIILASDDDLYHPKYLEYMNELVLKYPDVNVFRPRVQKINEAGAIIGVESYLKEYMCQLEYIYALAKSWVGSGIPFWMFRKDKLLSVGGFLQYPLAWFSDDATVIECADNGIVTTMEVLFSFRFSGINISTRKATKQELISKIEATDQYYLFLKNKINSIRCEDEIFRHMKTYIENNYMNYLGDDKLCGQMFNAPLWVSLSVSPKVAKLGFMSARRLFRYWFSNVMNSIVR